MERVQARELMPEEMEEQRRYAGDFLRLTARPRTYCVVTYGCQMNERDSETIAGILRTMGMEAAADREHADFVIFNTCCVRDNAQRRALGNITWLKELKRSRPELLVAACGCMMQEPGMGAQVLRQFPFVDLAFGTSNLHRLPELLYRRVVGGRRVIEVPAGGEEIICEGLPEARASGCKAYVNIMYGCNNLCTYCIVPFVRGRERSRSSVRILEEVKRLQGEGRREIMLLGQNVNSYGLDKPEEMTFPQLLKKVDETGIERIRFMTSHPKDVSDQLISVMAGAKHVCRSLHLPAQSGSDSVLARMNRHYKKADYLALVRKLREAMPDLCLTTDLIVGFPGETEEDFEETLELVERVRFENAFTFIYSKRPGTAAAKMEGQVPEEASSRRLRRLIEAQKEITREYLAACVGQVRRVLVEGVSRRSDVMRTGKDEYGISINFPGDAALDGHFVDVCILSCGESTLRGEMVERWTT